MHPQSTLSRAVERTCQQCGASFTTGTPRARDDRRKFCGSTCYHAAQRARSLSLDERFDAVRLEPSGACLLWTGMVSKTTGYGRLASMPREILAHRFAYERAHGPIPDGLTIDHLCRVRPCVNPEHMEAVTSGVNVLRGESPWAKNARKTHCVRGHAFDEANTLHLRGQRRCRACAREQAARIRAARTVEASR